MDDARRRLRIAAESGNMEDAKKAVDDFYVWKNVYDFYKENA